MFVIRNSKFNLCYLIAGKNITVNALHPGVVHTEFGRFLPYELLKKISSLLSPCFSKVEYETILLSGLTFLIKIINLVRSVLLKAIKIFCLTFQSAKEGAQTTIHLAVSDDVAKVTGEYFSDCKVIMTIAIFFFSSCCITFLFFRLPRLLIWQKMLA